MPDNLVLAPLIRVSTEVQKKRGESLSTQRKQLKNATNQGQYLSPKAYSYIRFSTPEQLKGDSLRRQIELSERYAKDHGLVIDDRLRLQDTGLSAFSGQHRSDGKLGQFLMLIESGRIQKGSVLLVESLDRLSREEIIIALEQFLSIIRRGITIVTLADNREYTEETINANVGELIVSLTIMARAHEESATKAMRLGKAWEAKRKQASNGTRKLTAKCPAWLELNKEKTGFIVIEEAQNAVRRIFEMKLVGKGVIKIVRELNNTPGIWKPGNVDKRKGGEGWRESYVKKILQTRAVIGEFQPHRILKGTRQPVGDSISDYFPAVVDKELFYRVQEQSRQNNHKGGQTGKVSNLFTYIAKCGYCGGSMAIIDKGPAPKDRKYLICDRARRGLNCCHASVKYSEFERLILTHCKGLHPQDILDGKDKMDSEISLLRGELEGIEGELNSIKGQKKNLIDSISKTSDRRIRETLEEALSDRLDKESSLGQKKDYLKQQIDERSRSFETMQLTLDSLRELLNFLNITKGEKLIEVRLKLRNELRKLLKQIDVYPEGGHPAFRNKRGEKALTIIIKPFSGRYQSINMDEERSQTQIEHPKNFCKLSSYRATYG